MDPPIPHLWRIQRATSVGSEATHIEYTMRLHQQIEIKIDTLHLTADPHPYTTSHRPQNFTPW
jgi:hypothetical protein